MKRADALRLRHTEIGHLHCGTHGKSRNARIAHRHRSNLSGPGIVRSLSERGKVHLEKRDVFDWMAHACDHGQPDGLAMFVAGYNHNW